MIEKIIFYPDFHEDLEIENAIATQIINDFRKRKIDSVFLETSYGQKDLLKNKKGKSVISLLPNEIPLFGVEHKPYHEMHIKTAKIAVLTYKAIKEGIQGSREKASEVMDAVRKASKNRMGALTQNLLVRCYDSHYEKPGIVCGGNHFPELKDLFEKRGFSIGMCRDYIYLLEKERKKSDYALRNFSVPLIGQA